ncbi:protein PFC0760c isoform X2 [Harpegnathos saltator]|uniref:protein PFC0760c isoform X2 n=1 Tax=Harpegnathos saltator TaxID=610380 RepID=UPI000590A907|nr:protein PFC0760c isoform X2 [Harpegnathos saltator]
MPRSTRDSDEEIEPKIGRRTRLLTTSSMIDSPIRRSSRIKQSIKLQKSSPDYESDTSVSSSQAIRTTRQRTATMDSITTETLRGRLRKPSISSETSEVIDIDIETPSKRLTRRSLANTAPSTPTKVSARIASKRLIRAGSETKSSPSTRTTRRTRASSVDPESMSDQTKSLINISSKSRRRASVLPSQSPVKEEMEEKQQEPGTKIDTILDEVKELISSEKATYSENSQEIEEIDDTNKNKIQKDDSYDEMVSTSASDKTFQQLEDNEMHSKHTVVTISDEKNLDMVKSSCIENSSSNVDISDEILIDDINSPKDKEENKSRKIENEEIENSLINAQKKSPIKELTIRLEDVLNTTLGGQKRSPGNKENQTLNIISDISSEKSTGPVITNITSLSTKSLTTVLANKPLIEKENKIACNELSKRRRSRESIEIEMKPAALLKESIANIDKMLDSFKDSSNLISHSKKNIGSPLTDDTTENQSLVHDVDKKSNTSDTVESVLSVVNNVKLVEDVTDDQIFVEIVNKPNKNITEVVNKLDKNDAKICSEVIDTSQESSCFSIVNNNNEMKLELEKSNEAQNKNKSLNESMKTITELNVDCSNESIDVENCSDKSIAVDKPTSTAHDDAKDNLLDSVEQIKSNIKADDTIQNSPSRNTMEVSEKIVANTHEKIESMNTLLKTAATSTQQKNENTSGTSDIGKKSSQLKQDQEVSENIEDDDEYNADLISLFKDIPKEDENNTIRKDSNPLTIENESEAECDLVLVDKQAWLAAESMKAIRDKEVFDYDSDDTVLMKSTTQASHKKRLSTIDESLLINVGDDDDDDDDNDNDNDNEEKQKQEEKEIAKSIKTRKSLIKEKSASEKNDSSTICINEDSSSSIELLNTSKKGLNRSTNRSASGLNKSGQVADQSVKILGELDDEIKDNKNRLNRSSQARRNTLRKSTERRESSSKFSKDMSLRQSAQGVKKKSLSKSQADDSEEEIDNIRTCTEKSLKKKKRCLKKLKVRIEDADIDESEEVESESKNSLDEESEQKEDALINLEDLDENDEVSQIKGLRRKIGVNYSTIAIAGSNNSTKSSDNTSDDSIKHYECVRSLFEKNNGTDGDDSNGDDDDDGIGSIDSDIKKEYNLDAAEQEHSDDNVPYDECRTSESESSDSDDGSDLADFIVADDAIEDDGKNEGDNSEDDEQGEENEIQEEEEQEEVEDKDVDDEQVENAEEDENEKFVKTLETNISKNNASDNIGKNKKRISTEYTAPCQLKMKDTKTKKSDMKKLKETIISTTSDLKSSIKKKKKSHINEIEQSLLKQLNESEINRKKLPRVMHTSMECSTPKANSSKQEFVNDIESATIALEAADMNETMQRKKRSRKDSIPKTNVSSKESKHIDEEEILHTSLPSDLLERVAKMKPRSKTIALNKTVNITHSETPTIRSLRKEKLNESAPELKLKETSQLQKRRSSKEENNLALKETDKTDDDIDEMSNLVALFHDEVQEAQESSQSKKQWKRKKQAEETLNENAENVPSQDTINLEIFQQQKKKKKNNDKLSQILTVEETVEDRQDMYQLNEKKKKKKINVTKIDENTMKDDIQQNDTSKKEKEKLSIAHDEAEHSKKKKKKDKMVVNVERDNIEPVESMIAKKNIKRQKTKDNKESLSKKSLQKKNRAKEKKQKEIKVEGKIPLPQAEASTSKSKLSKKTGSGKPPVQNVSSETVESKNIAFNKARSEALEAIKSAAERIELNKELKKKRENTMSLTQERDINIPIKKKKTKEHFEEEKQKNVMSSAGSLKRLPDNVIEKLSDMPTRTKRRKLSQNREQVKSLSVKNSEFLESKMQGKNLIPLSSNGSTTQFTIVNLSKTRKEPSDTVSKVMSYRQQMLNRNKREPISSYLMYLQKQRSASKDGFSDKAF